MADSKDRRELLTVVSLCLCWYVVSSSNNVVGKMLLNDFPYPMTVTMVQLLSITLYSGPFFNLWGVRRASSFSWKFYFKFLVPLALGKFVASVFTHVSIWKVPVSYAHTVKATMPLFTVVLSRIILGEKHTLKVYLSLVPIVLGVIIATMTELSFDLLGLLSALAATLQYSLQNIFSKKVLHDTGVHHLRLLQILGRLSFFLFIPFWLSFDLGHLMNETALLRRGQVLPLLLTDGFLNWLQNILAFSVMSMVSPLTYGVASASKRLFVIAASLIMLGNPVTSANVLGMTLAVLGVLAYNKAKLDARKVEKSHPLLPSTINNITMSPVKNHNGLANGFPSYTNNNSKISYFV
ncbi:solute carrier family 35 member E1 homolog [Cimex lectularius]|uniref:Sugar phosphate transporter domain-containing protein n=1 Tax=Cimex lectularius TaxID=79782 RepID=A0A8I6TE92_CIMLE|nr:solute carrier family 35 member E1 homolog [Cimex lectularius]